MKETLHAIIDNLILCPQLKLELNKMTGSITYQTKTHANAIPLDGDIVISGDNKVESYHYDRSKKKKLNTTCKFSDKTPTVSSPKGTVDIFKNMKVKRLY